MRLSIKTISILVLMSAACSCSKDNTVTSSGNEIIFGLASGISVEETTKGAVFSETLPDGSSFGVFGYCLAQTAPDNATLNNSSGPIQWEQKRSLSTPHLFYGQEVTYSGGLCSYQPVKEWYEPSDYRYSFFAYYPYGNFETLTSSTDFAEPRIKFSMPFDTAIADTASVLSLEDVPDAMVAMNIDAVKGAGKAELEFYHILTGLRFTVNNYNAAEDADGNMVAGHDVTIHSIKLRGEFYKSVIIDFYSGMEYTDDVFYGTYDILGDDEADIVIPGLTSVTNIGGKTILLVSNQSNTGLENGFLGDIDLLIDYSFIEIDGETRRHQRIARPENFQPSEGTIYTAQLNFIGDAFVLNFIVDNDSQWEDGGDSDIIFS